MDFHRLGKDASRHVAACTGLERKYRVVAGRTCVEQIDGTKIGLKARQRENFGGARPPRFEIGRRVERQQDGNRAAADPGKYLGGRRVELHESWQRSRIRGRQSIAAGEGKCRDDRGQGSDLATKLLKRRAPIHARGRDRRASEFVRGQRVRAGNEQKEG